MGTICSSPPSTEAEVVKTETTPINSETTAIKSETTAIKIYGCRGLRNADWTWIPGSANLSDAYVICTEKKNDETAKLLTTKTVRNSLEPIFDEEFPVTFAAGSTLEFTVYDKDSLPLKPDDLLGKAELKPAQFVNGFNGELPLENAGKDIKAYIKVLVKMSGRDYPPGPAAEFTIKIPRDKQADMGFTFDGINSTCLYVNSIGASGPVKDYNDNAGVNEQMKVGQYIVAVNGRSGDAQHLSNILGSLDNEFLELTLARPYCFTIAIKKKGTLGLSIQQQQNQATENGVHMIKEIIEGPVLEWNKANPDKQVKPKDIIVAVNGNRALGEKQMEMVRADGPMQLVLSRRNHPETKTFWHWF